DGPARAFEVRRRRRRARHGRHRPRRLRGQHLRRGHVGLRGAPPPRGWARRTKGWTPAPAPRTQTAYGADSRLQGLLAVHRPGPRRLAGVAAAWYFGNNPAGAPMYDPATGVT